MKLESLGVDLQYDAATPNWAQFGPADVTVAKTVTIFVVNNAGALTDVAAQVSRRINFTLELADTTLP